MADFGKISFPTLWLTKKGGRYILITYSEVLELIIMNAASGWDFTLANYDAVWAFLVQIGLLMMFMMAGNILRRTIPLFRKCLIPSALLGGGMLLAVDIICKQFGIILVDNRLMQVITYHCLAIGFAAMSLKTEKSTHKTTRYQVLEFGALQGGT